MRRDSALMVVGCHSKFYIVNLNVSHNLLVSYDEFKKASEADLAPMRISEGTIGEFLQTRMLSSFFFFLKKKNWLL